jgi:uncharacterized protein
VELHCVQDADRLDAIGAFGEYTTIASPFYGVLTWYIGILRTAAYSAAVNRSLYAPPEDPRSATCAIEHFHDKLLYIQGRLKTSQGRALGAQRHQFVSGLEVILS